MFFIQHYFFETKLFATSPIPHQTCLFAQTRHSFQNISCFLTMAIRRTMTLRSRSDLTRFFNTPIFMPASSVRFAHRALRNFTASACALFVPRAFRKDRSAAFAASVSLRGSSLRYFSHAKFIALYDVSICPLVVSMRTI